jgi:transposase
MKRIPRAAYTVEFKAAAVQQVLAGKTAAEVGRELGVIKQTLHNWMKAYRLGKMGEAGGKAVTPEQMENSRLRAELARTKMELEIVKKAAYFAKESL